MFRLMSSTTNSLGPQKAEELLRLNTFEGQRSIDRDWVEAVKQKIAAGTFVKGNVAVGECPETGEKYLMNGQHQLTAILESKSSVKVTIDYYTVDTPRDFADLFATFDTNRIRSQSQIMKAGRTVMKNENLRNISAQMLADIGSALLALSTPENIQFYRGKSAGPTIRLELLEQHCEDAIWVNDIIKSNIPPKKRMPVGTIAAMILTRRANQKLAEQFWPAVISGEGLVRNSPQWRLHTSEVKAVNGREKGWKLCATAICWWNTFCDKDGRRSVKLEAMTEMPKVSGAPRNLVQR